jgi:hypothetical protein
MLQIRPEDAKSHCRYAGSKRVAAGVKSKVLPAMRTFLIAVFLFAFVEQMIGQSPAGQNPAPSYSAHRRAKTSGQLGPTNPPAPLQNAPQNPAPRPVTPPLPPSQRQTSLQSPPTTPSLPTTEPSPAQESVPKVPASVPRVSYQNGELTVLAQNASLGEVLSAVRAATGLRIEGASGSGERVTAKIGPAPVRDVLLSLLEGSKYDFAMLGSANDPQKVERLVLSPRTATSNATYTAQQNTSPPSAENENPPQPGDDDDDSEGFAPAKPAATPPAANIPPSGQIKTPEQLLEDLRKLESEKAQQQQATQPSDPNAPRPQRPERPK